MAEWCNECEDYVEVEVEDQGIGAYEFWGQKAVDTRKVLVCKECGAPVDASYWEWDAERKAVEAEWRWECERDRRLEAEWDRKHGRSG